MITQNKATTGGLTPRQAVRLLTKKNLAAFFQRNLDRRFEVGSCDTCPIAEFLKAHGAKNVVVYGSAGRLGDRGFVAANFINRFVSAVDNDNLYAGKRVARRTAGKCLRILRSI